MPEGNNLNEICLKSSNLIVKMCFLDQTEDMWTPYKELYKSIEFNLARELPVPSVEFEALLRKYKQNFYNLLQNSVSSI